MKGFSVLLVACLAIGIVSGDIFETKKAPSFNKDGCEAKCLGLCLAGGNKQSFLKYSILFRAEVLNILVLAYPQIKIVLLCVSPQIRVICTLKYNSSQIRYF